MRGYSNYLTPEHVRASAALVRSGRTVSLLYRSIRCGQITASSVHYMVKPRRLPEHGEPGLQGLSGSELHGDCRTHVDALCHVAYKGKLYNGKSPDSVTSRGPTMMDITAYVHGIVGRSFARHPSFPRVKWLEPGEAVTATNWKRRKNSRASVWVKGHLSVRTDTTVGAELGPGITDVTARAGRLHVNAMVLLHERKVAAFCPTRWRNCPSNVEGFPIQCTRCRLRPWAWRVRIVFSSRNWSRYVKRKPADLHGVAAPCDFRGNRLLFNPIAISKR